MCAYEPRVGPCGPLVTHELAASVELDGSAVRQDGRSASLTAPNGSAQRILLQKTLSRAGVTSSDVMFAEAHGTGTPLGDPTEAGALASLHTSNVRSSPLVIGAAKASVGHSEPVSGQVGLLKVRYVLVDKVCVGNAQLRKINPLVNERFGKSSTHFMMPVQNVRLSMDER